MTMDNEDGRITYGAVLNHDLDLCLASVSDGLVRSLNASASFSVLYTRCEIADTFSFHCTVMI
jgi:hypothetical protein